MEAEIRKLQKRRDDSDDEDHSLRKPKKSYLGEELAKYAKIKGVHKKGKKRDEGDILAALSTFRGKLQNTMSVDNEGEGGDERTVGEGEEGMEVDGDIGFLAHELRFPKDNTEETEKAERDYEVIDPRQRGAKAREEEREKKRTASKIKGDRSRR